MRTLLSIVLLAPIVHAQGQAWADITPQSPAVNPTGRYLHGMTYDGTRQVAVLFGGGTSTSTDANSAETWEWNGVAWSQRTPAAAPTARRHFGFAFDPARGVSVVFGGYQSSSVPRLADTWEWNGTTWTQRTPPVAPIARAGHAMVFDAARQKVLLFGGNGTAGALADTWEFDGTAWAQRTPVNAPSARLGHAMAYDAARQRVVLFGGVTAATGGTVLGDTWEWDGTNWLARFSVTFPTPRTEAAMAYDAARARCVLYSGWTTNNDIDDTWEWNGTNWSQRPNGGIGVRRFARAVFDAGQQRVVLFGGLASGSSPSSTTWGLASAAAIEYGVGCGPTALGLEKDAASRPLIGTTGLATLTNAPTPVAGMSMGFSKTTFGPFTLPVPLDSVGMTGCLLWHSADILGLGLTPITSTSLVFLYPIPNAPSLIGGRIFLQGYCYAPGSNPLAIIASNGLEWRLGAF